MNEENKLRQRAHEAGLELRPSRSNPLPAAAFWALEDLELPFILGGAPCPGCGFSFTGAAPFMRFTLHPADRRAEFQDIPENLHELINKIPQTNVFQTLSVIMRALKETRPGKKKGPFPFNGGGVGFLSYDLNQTLFKMAKVRPSKQKKSLALPLAFFGFYDNIYVYDHKKERGYILSRAPLNERSEEFYNRIEGAGSEQKSPPLMPANKAPALTSSTAKEKYIRDIRRIKEYIASGDIYQINLSQRLSTPFTGNAFTLYEGLMRENPTPFSSFFDFGDFQLISNSPERLLRVNGRLMETSPIKGTRPRGVTPAEDRALIRELSRNIKERAEHVMIVDLERNDLGRVAVPGSVSVEKFEEIKSFSRLHHMVSTVRGRAPAGTDPFVILKNIFPGGSISGTPKIRAMEIIDELENVPREIYTGGAGYIDYCGDMDLSILIRTAILKESKLHLHVGGGIVADSVPEAEYDETLLKAMDFLSLLKLRADVLT